MAYTQRNYLRRVLKVQEIYKEHSDRGATNEWIYEHLIAPHFFISRGTFYNYLSVPAARELKRIHEESLAENNN